jgi:predicted extracellular nuclease
MKHILTTLVCCFLAGSLFAQKKPKNTFTIAFYNVENLFDTEDDPAIDDSEFLPTAENKWDNEKYQKKLANMSSAINSLGSTQAPDILGLCEIENKRVMEDLIAQPSLKSKNYGIVHYNSPDERGIDVGMIYKKDVFKPFAEKSCRIIFPEVKDKTRDFLIVSGILGGKDTLHVFVAHFPSRRGGLKESEHKRVYVASQVKSKVDSIQKKSPKANIVVMGDLNDEPTNKSIVETLNAKPYSDGLKQGQMFNTMGVLKSEGKGTHAYYNGKEKITEWNLLDQIILSPNLVNKKSSLRYVLKSATIHKPEMLMQQEPAQYKGQPLRTFAGKKYLGGYSDHFPVFIQLASYK